MNTANAAHSFPTAFAQTAESPAHSAHQALYVAFIVAPIVAGLDKFFYMLADWSQYLAPVVTSLVPARTFMMGVGVIEIAAGVIVAVSPRVGGYLVSAWLVGIIVNLLLLGNYYDVALRDLGLALAAFALARLSTRG